MEPLYGLLTTILVVCGLAGVTSNLVVVPETLDAVQGKKITLNCWIGSVPDLKLIQSSWERQLPSGKEILAVYHSEYGTSIPTELANRVTFVSATTGDVSITLDNVTLDDIGVYTCKASTFPLGNSQASTQVNVLVEPKVYVSASPVALVDGEGESLVATCIAEKGRPTAEVSWETDLRGRVEKQTVEETDGTVSVQVRYLWQPSSSAQGKTLTCVVHHPALQTEFRIPYVLNIQFAPTVIIEGVEKNWYAGQTDVVLICDAQANPPTHQYLWARLDGPMPNGVEAISNRFAFLRPLELNDSGVYRCEASNDVGTRSQDLSFWVQERPSTTATPSPTTRTTSIVSGTERSQFTSPTLAPEGDNMLGVIVGGVVIGLLFLILAPLAAWFCFIRKRRTFRGDYYTKQYLGPSDMQKETQLDVLQPHELQEVYGDKADKGSQELKPKLCGDVIYPDYTSKEQGGDDWTDREGDYYPDPYHGQNMHHPCGPPVLTNGSPYLSNNRYNNCTDSDYVAHVDGSVISRREWYV
ncbi:nectin-3-like protein [Corythoichthys intestinalis]|uniref:nectin-3-like protein n=1 Tax=Corythoichthys intestinalis TaxID=161448 RepID=UPI0025A4E331|nr:nectin-3-like protein [Corythoichthys intestinalis]XP_057694905.1 nectin-3-like protein [Corythoichthys intestinalis]